MTVKGKAGQTETEERGSGWALGLSPGPTVFQWRDAAAGTSLIPCSELPVLI